ncbi:NhaP-type Na+(K+)/H+ antiporter [Chitinivibrio alkaliphilus ACht1]|uniref:NhaP-type Na+(K+)/H+ antiporter n=2 Tax=Chitinivibrio TaxID=1505231 RepID=U7D9J3_9BACT|nr:NhaP-type Na+(K+)/H+ antiporter [Chitinivibrio alkaliphilus ACht1]
MDLNTTLFLLICGGYFFGLFFDRLKLPSILGMLIFGIFASLTIGNYASPLLWEVEPSLKSFALTIILLRAGLGIKKESLRKNGTSALLMSFLPATLETIVLTLALHSLLSFSLLTALLTATMLTAVSPAVIVPAMLDLTARNRGNKKDIPSLILAGASIDDVLAITLFSLLLHGLTGEAFSPQEIALMTPLALVTAVVAGAFVGRVSIYYFSKHPEKVRDTEKVLLLLVGAFFLISLGEIIHIASLLAIMTAGFIILEKNSDIAARIAEKLSKIWVFAEIILFVLIGFSLDLSAALYAGPRGVLIILIGVSVRSIGVWISTIPSRHLTKKERLFCVCAYIPKATVQAALGGVALSHGLPEGDIILALAVISILITAPVGLIGIRLGSTYLLTDES